MLPYTITLCGISVLLSVTLYSQTNKIETLKKEIQSSQNVEQKLSTIFSLCDQRQSLHTDTLCKYATLAKEISIAQKDPSNIAISDFYLGNCYVKKGELEIAFQLCIENLDNNKSKKLNANAVMKLTALKAQVLVRSNKHKEGLAEFYKLLSTSEQKQDTIMQMIAKNGIGWVNMEMDQMQDALRWFFRALQTSTNSYHHAINANIYSNIAAIYKQLNKNDSAEFFIKTAIIYSRNSQNIFFLANSLNILADIYINTKRYGIAEAPLKEALLLRKDIGDPFYIVSDMSQLAIYYANTLQPEKGIELSLKGIEMAKQLNLKSKLPYLYTALGENYKAAGNYKDYSNSLEVVMNLKDSVYAATTAEARAEMNAKYNVQKQENIIIQQKLDIVNRNYLLFGSLILAFFGIVTVWLVFKNYRKKQKIILQSIKEEERIKALQAVMYAEENERKRISADLHDNLGAYASAISANADDLSVMTDMSDTTVIKSIKHNAKEIMMSLRDTIWVLNKNEILLTGVSDRFKNYIKNIRESYPSLSIEIKENIVDDISLSPQYALNMLRIMQEAFHNALKHSKGNIITVDIISENGMQVRISDNGKGIVEEEKICGNGFTNMQMRAKANGWKLCVKRLQPKGTAVELSA